VSAAHTQDALPIWINVIPLPHTPAATYSLLSFNEPVRSKVGI